MSGKVIMKRKHEEDILAGPSSNISINLQETPPNKKREKTDCGENNSLISQSINSDSDPETSTKTSSNTSKLLMEALQKIVELQSELDDFENDLNEQDNISEHAEDSNNSFHSDEFPSFDQMIATPEQDPDKMYERHEAEVLGYAMCAREALLFLEREGISTNSDIYRVLRERLIGHSEGIPI